MLSVILLTVAFLYCYSECRYAECHSDFYIVMLSALVVSVIMLTVTFLYCYSECRYAECHSADCCIFTLLF